MDSVLNTLSSVASPWGYVIVGMLAMLEASAFVGLAVPGETALLIGGFLAYQGKASLVGMMAVAAVGAVVGDSMGYELGRRFGPTLRATRLGQRIGERRWQRAEEYLARHGGRAVFFGRFIGVLRALVPMMAGLSRMPYRRFLAWNAAGGLIWAPAFVGLGYLGGSSYRRIEHIAGRATVLVLILVVLVVAIAAAGRFIAAHQYRIVMAGQDFAARPRIARIVDRYRAQLRFLVGRFRPGTALGLSFTIGIVVAVALAWGFGTAINDVLVRGQLSRLDDPVRDFFTTRHEPFFTTLLHPILVLGSLPALAAALAVYAVWSLARRRDVRAPLLLMTCLFGAAGVAVVVRALVDRPGPASTSPTFPSLTVAAAVAFLGAAAVFAGERRPWRHRVLFVALATLAMALVAFANLYDDQSWFSDVVGGALLGALWTAVVLLPARTLGFLRHRAPTHAS